jgi:putative membrane-bound dehydrogenase-like protein
MVRVRRFLTLLCAARVLIVFAADAPAPVPVAEAVQSISLPEGFHATLFAGEPDVVQPIAMTTDPRGRLWVVECLSYPNWSTNEFGPDRVSIFEDNDGDGHFDRKTVFYDKGRNLTGIAVGFGGVYLTSLPELIFIPDADGDDKPDGAPQVLLDGWDIESKHNAFNGLHWGPDGWLYGCNGILGASKVGAPGTPDGSRVPFNCGVWRFHPLKKSFEVVANGTTNPWGIAFDEHGQMFVANCVIKHLFHIIPGAHYERMFGQDFNPYLFELIPSIADHIHWIGGAWNVQGSYNPKNDAAGGGHAHCGAFIYQGEDWPRQYQNTFFTINIHGHRINNDLLVPAGSGYVGKHGPDFMRVNDTWFRGVALTPSHDGGLYVSDWSDAGECHDYDDIHRENGRIYKVNYGQARAPLVNLARAGDGDLVANLASKNEWTVRQSRLLLQERAASHKLSDGTRDELKRALVLKRDGDSGKNQSHGRLRALWALHSIGGLSEAEALQYLSDSEPYIRAWTIQLALENKSASEPVVNRLARMARNDDSPVVRLYLASALQRLDMDGRMRVASGLARHAEDIHDHNLPLMIWYGIEPIASTDEKAALKLLKEAEIPLLRKFIAQRLSLRRLMSGLAEAIQESKPEAQGAIIDGMFAALNGQSKLSAPPHWKEIRAELQKHPSPGIRNEVLRLSLIFGDPEAIGLLKAQALDKNLSPIEREQSIEALAQDKVPGLAPFLQNLVAGKRVRLPAIRALASYDDPETPAVLLKYYPALSLDEKNAAISVLTSRAAYSEALLKAVEAGTIPAREISPFATRQMQAYKNPAIDAMLGKLATVRGVSSDKKTDIAKYKALFTPEALRKADARHGRELFQRTCATCHTLFGEGGKVAPELTGAQRSSLDYLLDNIVDPNAVVWDQYKATYFETKDDRLISGVIVGENESAVTIQTPTGVVKLPLNEIASRRKSNLSLMPEGLLSGLPDQDIVDLITYLQSPTQVSLK